MNSFINGDFVPIQCRLVQGFDDSSLTSYEDFAVSAAADFLLDDLASRGAIKLGSFKG